MPNPKPLVFSAFNMLAPSHHDHGQWANPRSRQLQYTDPRYWIHVAQTLERARFDLLFFADVLAPYETVDGTGDLALSTGLQAPVLDAASIVSLLAGSTEELSFAFTQNVLQEPPYSFARKITTLDHLSGGRLGWNVVTGSIAGTGRNLGYGGLPAREDRYARAEEYLDVVYRLWEQSWDEEAVLRDRKSGRYADPSLIRAIGHTGEFFDVPGRHVSEPSPQRTPVIFTAGASDRFAAFAGTHAEGVFSSIEVGDPAQNVARIRAGAERAGRNPADLKIFTKFAFVLGSTEAEARALDDELAEFRSPESLLVKLAESAGAELAWIPWRAKLSQLLERHGEERLGGLRARLERAPDHDWTFEEYVRWTGRQHTVGTPEQIADAIERWRDVGVDGLNVHYLISPGSWEDFADHLSPVLTERGLLRGEHEGQGTLRERLFGRSRLDEGHPARARRLVGSS
ncbi:NtaA/DmoA family FMN-dependent monooxygenase [Leucobacter celer]|uniref:NtaA/DmoA family FMN-dependent monooxygenase n=1 Tax=Leucobacter celer TaxID=668625 RepID=UPI0006A7810A|nr:NtaA/DmoA family FMN-dependent monooxygenase [Leucobacter celer]